MLSTPQENCGIGAKKYLANQYCLLMINHHPQRVKKENKHPKKSNKNRPNPPKIITDDDDDWMCEDCGEVWDDDGDCCWITCDICLSNYHLECSGIQYPMEQYWEIDLDLRELECPDCIVYFQSDWLLVYCKT